MSSSKFASAPARASDEPGESPDHPSAAQLSAGAGVMTAAVGAFVLCGWVWDIESFKTIYGPITMKTNAAIGLLLCGTSLAMLHWAPRLAAWGAMGAALIGGLTLSQHLVGWDLGIDQLLFTEAPGAAATASPNRFGPNAATGFLLAGIALVLLARHGARGAGAAQQLSLVALVLASVPLAGYLYGAEQLYGIASYTGIALHTALAFVILNLGILLARCRSGPVAVFLSPGPAGTVLRRLALPFVAVPLLLGYALVSARTLALVDRGLGVALYAIALIVSLGLLVWRTAQAVDRSDAARRAAERERDVLILKEREARADAERANHLKDRFLATLSHELRTPLNVMLGWTQILERGASPSEHPRIAALVAKNGRLLARLVEDLLDHSRVTTGQLEISPVPTDLNVVVQGSLDAIAPMAEGKQIGVTSDLYAGIEPIEADTERLQQIVWNLLSNAVKFTGRGGRIVVRTAVTADAVLLSVCDTGVGFDAAFASELFEPFRQADSSTSREHGGLGLGLSIAKHIAERHGGTLTGTSPGRGHGATFTLSLPRRLADGDAQETSNALQGPTSLRPLAGPQPVAGAPPRA